MATYSSQPTVINRPAAELVEKFADFRSLQHALDALDAEQRKSVGEVEFDKDTIKIITPQVGAITLRAVERTAERMRLEAENAPVPLSMIVNFKALGPESTELTGALDVDLPMMLKPLVGPALQTAANRFGELFSQLA